jgi:hypothetical protein
LTQNSNTIELANFLEKTKDFNVKSKLHWKLHQEEPCGKRNTKKRVKIRNSMGITNLFFDILPYSPWAMLATWLHLVEYKKIRFITHCKQTVTKDIYKIGIGYIFVSP